MHTSILWSLQLPSSSSSTSYIHTHIHTYMHTYISSCDPDRRLLRRRVLHGGNAAHPGKVLLVCHACMHTRAYVCMYIYIYIYIYSVVVCDYVCVHSSRQKQEKIFWYVMYIYIIYIYIYNIYIYIYIYVYIYTHTHTHIYAQVSVYIFTNPRNYVHIHQVRSDWELQSIVAKACASSTVHACVHLHT